MDSTEPGGPRPPRDGALLLIAAALLLLAAIVVPMPAHPRLRNLLVAGALATAAAGLTLLLRRRP